MGLYINPPDDDKRKWLRTYGVELFHKKDVSTDRKWYDRHMLGNNKVFVCLVNNGPFDALGVAYDYDEFCRWVEDDSDRPMLFAICHKDDVLAVEPGYSHWYKGSNRG